MKKSALFLLPLLIMACDDGAENRSLPEPPPIAQRQSVNDTLVYSVSDTSGLEPYHQQMTLKFLNDSSVWFSVEYDHAMAQGEVEGIATRASGRAPITDEYRQTTMPVWMFTDQQEEFNYSIRIHANDSNVARIVTSSERATDVIPLSMPMDLERHK